ncbi:MAG: hypothetical protein ACREWG_02880 [Gammaproteobacteria bacterium]
MIPANPRSALAIGLTLALLMAATRSHHFAATLHLPDASWAVFFLAGCYLRPVWMFPALIALAGVSDYVAITWFGVSDFCVSPAYGFLLPAYGALWFAGRWYAGRHRYALSTFVPLAGSVIVGAVVCEVLSSGGFYWFSGRFEPSLAELGSRLVRYFPMSLASMVLYTVIVSIVHLSLATVYPDSRQRSALRVLHGH